MATANAPRAADRIEGIGPGLETIMGRDVKLIGVKIENRPMKGDTNVFNLVRYTEVEGGEVKSVHAWSQSLAEKLVQLSSDYDPDVPLGELIPLSFDLEEPFPLAKFVRVRTTSGFFVWSIE